MTTDIILTQEDYRELIDEAGVRTWRLYCDKRYSDAVKSQNAQLELIEEFNNLGFKWE